MNFFITGLPRSGTAWLANYLSYGNVLCLHDGLKDFQTPKKMKEFFDASGAYACGNSDPGNLVAYNALSKEFPDAKWVLITRPQKDVVESCKTIDMPIADLGEVLKQFPKTAMKVPFSKLFEKADDIGRYVYEDWESPPWRLDMLKTLNVQLHWNKVSEQFHVPKYVIDNTTLTMTSSQIAYMDALEEICNKDPNILRFLEQTRWAADLYHRIVEKKPIDIEQAKATLEAMALEWPLNPWLRAQSVVFTSTMANCLVQWDKSKPIHACPVETELPSVVSFLLGGMTKVKEDMPRLKELAKQVYQEKLRRES